MTDREVGAYLGLGLFTVRGILTSPLYAGRLRDGSAGHWRPIVTDRLWSRVQELRSRRATNTGRPADPRRPYSLDMLRCAACGKRLTGDTGYYRHREPCEAFVAAKPCPESGRGRTNPGQAYRMEICEGVVEALLEQASVGASETAQVVGAVHSEGNADRAAGLAQIEREQDRVLDRYRRDRDTSALDGAMRALDTRAATAAAAAKDDESVPAA